MKQFCRKFVAATLLACMGAFGVAKAQNALPGIVEKEMSLRQASGYSLFHLSSPS